MKLSIVGTLYQSSPYIDEFCRRATAAAQELVGNDYEIILVNDGSPDDSLERAVELTDIDDHITVIDLSRNFGHHKAMMTGLAHAKGERVFLIDTDLEEEPEWLLRFAQTMSVEHCDVVYGVQISRKGNWFERWSGEVFYSIFNWLSDIDHPRNIVTARLMTRDYVKALLQFRERAIVISCLWVITGFRQCSYIVRKHGNSKTSYSFIKKMVQATNSILSFSEVPLRLIFYSGLVLFACSLAYSIWLIFNYIFYSRMVDGWTSLMVSIWLFGGIIVSSLGIIGLYIAKIFTETKQRPYAIIRAIYKNHE